MFVLDERKKGGVQVNAEPLLRFMEFLLFYLVSSVPPT